MRVFLPMYMRHSNIFVLAGSGHYRMVSEPRLSVLSTFSWEINGKETWNWIAWISVIQSNYRYKVIYFLLIVLSLAPESFQSFDFSVLIIFNTNLRYE